MPCTKMVFDKLSRSQQKQASAVHLTLIVDVRVLFFDRWQFFPYRRRLLVAFKHTRVYYGTSMERRQSKKKGLSLLFLYLANNAKCSQGGLSHHPRLQVPTVPKILAHNAP